MSTNSIPVLPSPLLWLALGGICAVDFVWIVISGFSVNFTGGSAIAIVAAILAAVAVFYTLLRPIPQISGLCTSLLFLIVLPNAIATFSYLTTSLNFPLLDSTYASVDRAMGFDWPAFLAWTNDHPLIGKILILAYHSSTFQMLAVVVILSATGRLAHLNEFLSLFLVTVSVVIVLAGLFPAAGAYAFYMPAPEAFANLNPEAGMWHYEHFNGLRDGSLRHLDLATAEGLVTFPSFHTCLAIITAWSLREMRWLFIPAIALNTVVIVSTLPEGGHHLIDVIVGAGIALTVLAVASAWRRKLRTRSQSQENVAIAAATSPVTQ